MPATKQKPKSVAIVEDHSFYRDGLSDLIEGLRGPNNNKLYNVIIKAEDGSKYSEKLEEVSHPPDLVISDIKMPVMDGLETLKLINSHVYKPNVLMLSFYDDDETILKFMKEGAVGFLTKDATPDLITKAILSITEKGFFYNDHLTSVLLKKLKQVSFSATDIHNGGNSLDGILSKREKEILELFATELSYKEISDKLCISTRTIDGHKENMFRKLGVNTRTGLVLKGIKNGIINPNKS